MSKYISIKGASANNLKNISLEIPHHALSIICGVSGSGKSSLIYDVIGKEGQRIFYDHFISARAQKMIKLGSPQADEINSLFAVVALNQRGGGVNPRSTLGTISGIWDLFRLLFARFASSEISNIIASRSLFSFNTSVGQCSQCKGLGLEDRIDPDLLIGDSSKTLREGALVLTTPKSYIIYSQVTMDELDKVCKAEGFSVDIPWKDLSEKNKNVIFFGSEKETVLFGKHTLESRLRWKGITAKPRAEGFYKGVIPVMEEILRRDRNPNILRFARSMSCSKCQGKRLNKNALSFLWKKKNIEDFHKMDIKELNQFFQKNQFDSISENNIVKRILEKTNALLNLGAEYLSLNRLASSLSAGEMNRIRLAAYSTANLRNILYILDEPAAGLHVQEQRKLMKVIRKLVDGGNTVLMVDHHEQILTEADYIIDIGPAAGEKGGEIVFSGEAKLFFNNKIPKSKTRSLLGQNLVLNNTKLNSEFFYIKNACKNNLKNIDVPFLKEAFNIISGVSGAGKSSLAEAVYEQMKQEKQDFKKVIFIDQKPFGRSPRSNPSTYTGLSDVIRDLFASENTAKEKAFSKRHFSFAVPGGRCEDCGGAGFKQIGMHFLGNVDILCETCNGRRFKKDVLEIKYKNKNIFDVLELSFDQALVFFNAEKKALRYIQAMISLGLGYIKLGQASTTLSGGEAQRVKLASELSKTIVSSVLYILDEPANGLHAYDVQILINALRNLTEKKHTIIVIEHDLRCIAQGDHIVEIGHGSGKEGGNLVFAGLASELILMKNSPTGKALSEFSSNEKINEKRKFKKDFDKKPLRFKKVETNNLQIDQLCLYPRKIYAVCGVSGAGKSSLLFDSIHAIANEEFTSGMSSSIRQYANIKGQPVLEEYSGLMPVIALEKKSAFTNPRSTIGTYTGIYELFRLLFSRFAKKNGKYCTHYSSAFSFNHEQGACMNCKGLGFEILCDSDKLVKFPENSLFNAAMNGSKQGKFYGDPQGQYIATLLAVGKKYNIDFSVAYMALTKEEKQIAMFGCGEEIFNVEWEYKRGKISGIHKMKIPWLGFCKLVDEEYSRKHTDNRGEQMLQVMSEKICPKCNAFRLEPERLEYKIRNIHIGEMLSMNSFELRAFISAKELMPKASENLCVEIIRRLDSIIQAGIAYASLDRLSSSLSGGEFQRLRLAGLLRSSLSGVLYVIDEPSFALSTSDAVGIKLLLKELHENGNTLLFIDHNPQMLELADEIIELGPKAGINGGRIISKNDGKKTINELQDIISKIKSLPRLEEKAIFIEKANIHNLEDLNASFPKNTLSVITGNSGSGKTSLLNYVINKSLTALRPVNCKSIRGMENFSSVLYVEQDVYAGSALSIPASYLDLLDTIRKLFAEKAKKDGKTLKASHFSFFTKDGQCPHCRGSGINKISMDFLSDVISTCEVCEGKRFNQEPLNVLIEEKNIADVLSFNIEELSDFLKRNLSVSKYKKIDKILKMCFLCGLSYLSIGQNMNTLSSGELQRLKLVKYIGSLSKENALLLLDEPGAGLHPKDMLKLLDLFDFLIKQGHSIICASHNEMIMKRAAYCFVLQENER